jgi:hypothetical protein
MSYVLTAFYENSGTKVIHICEKAAAQAVADLKDDPACTSVGLKEGAMRTPCRHPDCRPPRCTDQAAFEAEQEAWEKAWAACYAPGATAEELAEMRRYYGDHG